MIYVPILKTRIEEKNVAKELKGCFDDNIIPLFEVISDEYNTIYMTNPETGKFIYKKSKNGNRKYRVKEQNIKPIDYISELIGNKTTFIDFFRFSLNNYGKNINIDRVLLSWKLSEDPAFYKEKIRSLIKIPNYIPVVSIKTDFKMNEDELKGFLEELKYSFKRSIALRLTDDFIDEYKNIIENVLDYRDYLLFDVGEQPISSKNMEFSMLSDMNIAAKIIIVNSPRKRGMNNSVYPKNDYVPFIDNSAKDFARRYNFDGFSDYCGYKDDLPRTRNGSGGKGAALILLYMYSKNQFYSLCEQDTKKGQKGYKELKKELLKHKKEFDKSENCYAFKKIDKMSSDSAGGWRTWNNICIRRYISEIYHNQKDL
jgi:hypothetical protein